MVRVRVWRAVEMDEKVVVVAILFAILINVGLIAAVTAVIAFFTAWPLWLCAIIGFLGVEVVSRLFS